MALISQVITRQQKKNKLLKKYKNISFWQEYKGPVNGVISALLLFGGFILGAVSGVTNVAWTLIGPGIATLLGGVVLSPFYNDEYFITKKDYIKNELANMGYDIKEAIDNKGKTFTIIEDKKVEPVVKKTRLEAMQEQVIKLKNSATQRAKTYVEETAEEVDEVPAASQTRLSKMQEKAKILKEKGSKYAQNSTSNDVEVENNID